MEACCHLSVRVRMLNSAGRVLQQKWAVVLSITGYLLIQAEHCAQVARILEIVVGDRIRSLQSYDGEKILVASGFGHDIASTRVSD